MDMKPVNLELRRAEVAKQKSLAEYYGKVRAATYDETVTRAEQVAVLDLIKYEILSDMHDEIHGQ